MLPPHPQATLGFSPCETCVSVFETYVWVCAKSLQPGPTLCDPMDCSLRSSSVSGTFPGKNTGVGCHALNPGIKPVCLTYLALAGGFFTTSSTWTASIGNVVSTNNARMSEWTNPSISQHTFVVGLLSARYCLRSRRYNSRLKKCLGSVYLKTTSES